MDEEQIRFIIGHLLISSFLLVCDVMLIAPFSHVWAGIMATAVFAALVFLVLPARLGIAAAIAVLLLGGVATWFLPATPKAAHVGVVGSGVRFPSSRLGQVGLNLPSGRNGERALPPAGRFNHCSEDNRVAFLSSMYEMRPWMGRRDHRANDQSPNCPGLSEEDLGYALKAVGG